MTGCSKCMIVNMSFVNISRFPFFSEGFFQPDILQMMFLCLLCECCHGEVLRVVFL